MIALSGPRQVMVELVGPRAEEVEDKELLDIPLLAAEIMLISPKLAARTLGDLSREDWTRGLYLRSVSRGGQEIPVAEETVLQRGDLLRVVGPEPVVQKSASSIGAMVAPSSTTDFVVLGLAIFLGGVAGVLLTFSVGGIKISLSTSVGTLLAGLLVGHMRTRLSLVRAYPRRRHRPYDVTWACSFRWSDRDPCGADLSLRLERGRDRVVARRHGGDLGATNRRICRRSFRASNEPDSSSGRPGRRADGDRRHGGRPGALREPGRSAGIYASLPYREYSADDLGHDRCGLMAS